MKKRLVKIKTLRNRADRLCQENGRHKYKTCLICDNPISCLHHYFPKSMSSALRYDEDNLIPLCSYHHFSHHNSNPEVHNLVNSILGDKWLKDLTKKKHTIVKTNKGYYLKVIEKYGNT